MNIDERKIAIGGDCTYGTYASGVGVSPSANFFTLPTTPTTVSHSNRLMPGMRSSRIRLSGTPSITRLPIGLSPGRNCLASASLITVTRGAWTVSPALKTRPARTAIPIARK